MHDRSALGPADVDDDVLAAMVADLLGHPPAEVELLESRADPVAYDLPAITTAARHWVSGRARTPRGEEAFRVFVKRVQAWHRHPFFAGVPPEFREVAAASVPWRTEHLAYRSDLADRLPDGLHMPRALAVLDLEDDAAAIWLEDVTTEPVEWGLERYRRAAYLLGRLAASPRVAVLADVGEFPWSVLDYVFGRLDVQVAPILRSEEVWAHPAVAAAFGTHLRDRLRAACDRSRAYAEELAAFPILTGHGDASPNNLMPGPTPDSFVLIDYGFWGPRPLGFDLGQLLVGEVQLGRCPAARLAETDAAIVESYHRGLAEEGLDVAIADLRRAHALHVLLFTGLSALPFDELERPPEQLGPLAHERAALAAYCLDLVDATS